MKRLSARLPLVLLTALLAARGARAQSAGERSVEVLGPDGRPRFEVDSHYTGDTELPEMIADVPGVYRFRVTTHEKHVLPGVYSIAIDTVEPATETHRKRIAAARAYARGSEAYRPLVRVCRGEKRLKPETFWHADHCKFRVELSAAAAAAASRADAQLDSATARV